MANFTLEDDTGTVGIVVFPDTWAECPPLEDEPAVLVRGQLKAETSREGKSGEGKTTRLAGPAGGRSSRRGSGWRRRRPSRPRSGSNSSSPSRAAPPPRCASSSTATRAGPRSGSGFGTRASRPVLQTRTEVHATAAFARDAVRLLGPDSVLLDGRPVSPPPGDPGNGGGTGVLTVPRRGAGSSSKPAFHRAMTSRLNASLGVANRSEYARKCLPIRALSAGRLAGPGARPALSTDCYGTRFA